ncbi:MAG: hypothetical protein GX956_05975, partial [Firmicutes bacterium]|nr:hypothetical protein [Bacillota bacterium]
MAFNAEQLLGPKGLLAKELATYEYRLEQLQMADHVYTSLQQGGHGIIEAGT